MVFAAAVVVVMRPVMVVERDVVVALEAEVAVAVVLVAAVVGVVGRSGAALFCTCVAAKALREASELSVTAVAMARSSTAERMIGERFEGGRVVTPVSQHRVARST